MIKSVEPGHFVSTEDIYRSGFHSAYLFPLVIFLLLHPRINQNASHDNLESIIPNGSSILRDGRRPLNRAGGEQRKWEGRERGSQSICTKRWRRGREKGEAAQENRALQSNAYNFKRGSFDSKVNRPGIRLPELSLTSNTVLQGTLLSATGFLSALLSLGTSLRHRDEDLTRVPTMLHRINWYPRPRSSCVAVEHRHGAVHRRNERMHEDTRPTCIARLCFSFFFFFFILLLLTARTHRIQGLPGELRDPYIFLRAHA